ncbi:MAG TPA: ComEC/Rec2 family competence protein, partial [Actinomycetota bacterium]|nr:ComEC/Rec2 family competence protein [Actinomycetota bacterium]
GCIALALGWASARAASRDGPLDALARAVPRCDLRGVVQERAGGLGDLVWVEVISCDGRPRLADAGVVALDGGGDIGFEVDAEGWLLPLGEGPFDASLRRAGAHAVFDPRSVQRAPPEGGLAGVAHSLRRALRRATAPLEGDRAGLLRGLAIGDTSSLGPHAVETLRRAGLSHLVAVSGSNVAIVVGCLVWALAPLGLRARVAGALLGLALFVVVVGPEPSVLRAAAMGAVGLAALASGRRSEPLHALALALIAVIGARPHLALSVGLALSASATGGIVLWARPVARRLGWMPRPLALGLAATLSAQAAVAPLLIAVFGAVSVTAPAANLLALPAIAPATVLGLGAALAGALFEPAGRALARGAEPFVAWVLWVGDLLGAPAWASAEVSRGWALPLAAVVAALVCGALATRRGRGGVAPGAPG